MADDVENLYEPTEHVHLNDNRPGLASPSILFLESEYPAEKAQSHNPNTKKKTIIMWLMMLPINYNPTPGTTPSLLQ
jgi:hypothetical protein